MRSQDCFAYTSHYEVVELSDGKRVKLLREECKILTHMMCRRQPNAKEACRFFKTSHQFKDGLKKYGGEKPEGK